jgi:hypothetical protein
MQNDLAIIFLALFVPWQNLLFLFSKVAAVLDGRDDADWNLADLTSIVWTRLKDSLELPAHVQEL